jgi:hypothetical protein
MKKFLSGWDFVFNKMLPKKLIVFTVATVLVFGDKISGDMWGYIALTYLGVNLLRHAIPPGWERIKKDEDE